MTTELQALGVKWNKATGSLAWGVQRTFYEALKAVEDGQIGMAYGRDYNDDGTPCLVNSTATMLGSIQGVGGTGKPSQHFSDVVRLFDQINRVFERGNLNVGGKVSHEAANFLVRHFGSLKTVEEAREAARQEDTDYISLRGDNELAQDWIKALSTDAPTESENFEDQVLRDLKSL